MFTSRAEYRLMLRHDNADLRLTELGTAGRPGGRPALGPIPGAREAIARLRGRLSSDASRGRHALPDSATTRDDLERPAGSRPEPRRSAAFAADAIEQVTIEAKYDGYIGRQIEQIERFRRLEDKPIPADFDYRSIPQLAPRPERSSTGFDPLSLGQAGRISGISPADIATLLDSPQATATRNRPPSCPTRRTKRSDSHPSGASLCQRVTRCRPNMLHFAGFMRKLLIKLGWFGFIDLRNPLSPLPLRRACPSVASHCVPHRFLLSIWPKLAILMATARTNFAIFPYFRWRENRQIR